MRRLTISDIVRESGISRATVDRVLNNRPGVHPRTRSQVEQAISKLNFEAPNSRPRPGVDFALQVDSGLLGQLAHSLGKFEQPGYAVHDLALKNETGVAALVRDLCEDISRPLVITVKKMPSILTELTRARRRGKTVVALVSDLPPDARDVFVGIDNRAAGETAAFLVGRSLGDRRTAVGIVLGDHAFHCHEDRELGFRSGLRAHFPKVVSVGEAVGQDSPLLTRSAVLQLLEANPGIAALYNVSGGNVGMAEAIAEAGRDGDILAISHEANATTLPALRTGRLDFLLSQDPDGLVREALKQAELPRHVRSDSVVHVDFNVHTRHNVPSYGQMD